ERQIGAFNPKQSALKSHVGGVRFENRGSDAPSFIEDLGGCLMHDETRQPERPAGMSAAAGLHESGIASAQCYMGGQDAEPLRHQLRERRFVALAGALGSNNNVNAPV